MRVYAMVSASDATGEALGRVRTVAEGGGRVRVEAPRVFAAAGVLGTPALLLRSDLPHPERVGRDLQLHSSLSVTARFAEPVHGYYGPTMGYSVSEFADVNGHRGPGFLLENTAVHPIATSLGLPGMGAAHAHAMAALPHLARCVGLLRDRTRGRLRLDDAGRPRLAYAPAPGDLARMRAGVVAAARAYRAAGAREVFLPVHAAPSLGPEADPETAVPELEPSGLAGRYAVHLFGGAAMADAPARGACDARGRVWGVRGLHVCDASALPGNTGVNPQITIMANALRIADAALAAERAA